MLLVYILRSLHFDVGAKRLGTKHPVGAKRPEVKIIWGETTRIRA